MSIVVLELAEINQILQPVRQVFDWSFVLNFYYIWIFIDQYIVTPLFQTLAALNVITYMFGSWGFNVIVKTLKGLDRSTWNQRMVYFGIESIEF